MMTQCYRVDYSWKRGTREMPSCITHMEVLAGLSNYELRQRFERVLRKLRPGFSGINSISLESFIPLAYSEKAFA